MGGSRRGRKAVRVEKEAEVEGKSVGRRYRRRIKSRFSGSVKGEKVPRDARREEDERVGRCGLSEPREGARSFVFSRFGPFAVRRTVQLEEEARNRGRGTRISESPDPILTILGPWQSEIGSRCREERERGGPTESRSRGESSKRSRGRRVEIEEFQHEWGGWRGLEVEISTWEEGLWGRKAINQTDQSGAEKSRAKQEKVSF